MNVLIACEYSGIVRDAFSRRGHNAWSCDILPTESEGQHYRGDLFEFLKIKTQWDLIIAHPPCTYLTNAGVSWLHKDVNRWVKLFEGALFFKKIMDIDCDKIAIENPIMHKYAKAIIGKDQTQVIQPYHFGHMESKATCLWLKNLEPLKETNNVKKEMMKLSKKERQRLHYLPPSPDRAKLRSKTFQGIADAMAEQWG